MSEIVDSVNRIVAHFDQGIRVFEERGNAERAGDMSELKEAVQEIFEEYQRLEKLTRPIVIVDGDDFSDLPPELLTELSVAKTDDLENQIATVINAIGGEADIDDILINLFRSFKVVQTRKYLQNKLWRMIQKGFIFSVDGKKGHYSTSPSEAEKSQPLSETEDESPPNLDDEIPF